jgi:hypothetical protein
VGGHEKGEIQERKGQLLSYPNVNVAQSSMNTVSQLHVTLHLSDCSSDEFLTYPFRAYFLPVIHKEYDL